MVGVLALIVESLPSDCTAYEEIAEALWPPVGPVSQTSAAPFGANETANAPAPPLGLTTIDPNFPSL
jgi:hypothetical protein